jgi:hypothetical protein
LMKTGLNNVLLHDIVHSCQQYWTILLHPIKAQQYCSILLTSVNNVGSKTLFNPVKQRAQRFYACKQRRFTNLIHMLVVKVSVFSSYWNNGVKWWNRKHMVTSVVTW